MDIPYTIYDMIWFDICIYIYIYICVCVCVCVCKCACVYEYYLIENICSNININCWYKF